MLKGKFIVFEGGEGTGKTTQINLIKQKLENSGKKIYLTREPGGTDCVLAEKIRDILKDPNHSEMAPETELFLFFASRAQHVKQKINQAMANDYIIICDRFFGSTLAYQHFGRGLFSLEEIKIINKFATGGLEPDLTIYLDINPEIGINRKGPDAKNDRLDSEALDFHHKVRHGFNYLAQNLPNWHIIDANQDIEAIHNQIWEKINQIL